MRAAELAALLAQDAEAVCKKYLPNGKRVGNEWCAGSVDGEAGNSCKVRLSGPKEGVWADFASEGVGGDLLDLIRLSRGLSVPEAMDEARAYLGVQEPQFEGHKPRQYRKPEKPKCHSPKGAGLSYLTEERGLSLAAIDTYKLAERDGVIVFPYLLGSDLVFVKYLRIERKDGKKVMWSEEGCEPILFGWQAIPDNAREVTICEGEIDAASCWQMGYPALSLPTGATGMEWIEGEHERLERFDRIYLCLDNDEAGAKGLTQLVDRLGRERCLVVKLPTKDANEALQKRIDVTPYFAKAQTLDPAELRSASTYADEIVREFYPPDNYEPGFYSPWDRASGKIKFRPAELTIVNGVSGHGKSQWVGHVALSAMEQGERVCIASMEIKPRRLLMRLTKQAAGLNLGEISIPYIRTISEWYGGKLWIFDVVGAAKAPRLLEVMGYARRRYGVTAFVIDSLMKCGIAGDDYAGQKAFIETLCDFKNEHDCHIFLVTHSRKSESEERPTGKFDVAGTADITNLADNVLTIWRNKAKEREVETMASEGQECTDEIAGKPDGMMFCSKQRNGEWEGKLPLWWHPASNQFLGASTAKPHQYVYFTAADAQQRTEQ